MLKMKGLVEYGVRQLFLVLFLFDVMHWMSWGAQYSLYGASRHGLIFYAEISKNLRAAVCKHHAIDHIIFPGKEK